MELVSRFLSKSILTLCNWMESKVSRQSLVLTVAGVLYAWLHAVNCLSSFSRLNVNQSCLTLFFSPFEVYTRI